MAPVAKSITEEFRENGFVRVPRAFDGRTTQACVDVIESALRAKEVDARNSATWTSPVVRIPCPEDPAFAKAGTSPKLWAVYDALLGPGNWVKRQGVGGSVPIRFPSDADPGDAGWHIDGSYEVDGRYFVNVHSRSRALLLLFLFTDVTPDDAPTELLVGSFRDVAQILQRHGEQGACFDDIAPDLPRSTFDRERAFAIGRAGDVFVCHPFLVHRATWPHRGRTPRIIAQPELAHRVPFALKSGEPRCVVEEMIMSGLSW